MTYKAETLIDGWKLGKEYIGKTFVAVPQHKAKKGNLIEHKDQKMVIEQDPLFKLIFPDKFGRGSYILCYFEWKLKEV